MKIKVIFQINAENFKVQSALKNRLQTAKFVQFRRDEIN